MEGICKFWQEKGYRYFPCNDDISGIDVSEAMFNDEQQTYEVHDGKLNETELPSWLDAPALPEASRSGTLPSLRIVWIPFSKEPYRMQIRQPNLDFILKKFEIETAFKSIQIGFDGIVSNLETSRLGKQSAKWYAIYLSYFQPCVSVDWSYDSITRSTQGICMGTTWEISIFRELLKTQTSLIGDPVALAYVFLLARHWFHETSFPSEIRAISEVENRTGHHSWIGGTTVPTAAKGDYSVLSARMSGSATLLASVLRTIKLSQQVLSFISECNDLGEFDAPTHPYIGVIRHARKEVENALKQIFAAQEIEQQYHFQRTQIQLTAIFNLITQRDANLNIALAKDSRTLASASKRDSSSMKTLAAVTVAFLSGTFVASFFAMPLFNWDASHNSSVVKGRFWIYWAVSIPLTLVTIISWLSWTHRQTLLHRAQDRKDRQKFAYEVSGKEDPEEEREVRRRDRSRSRSFSE